jgi:hypothetical protein
MVERLVPLLGRGDRDLQVGFEFILADEIWKVPWAQAEVKRLILRNL